MLKTTIQLVIWFEFGVTNKSLFAGNLWTINTGYLVSFDNSTSEFIDP